MPATESYNFDGSDVTHCNPALPSTDKDKPRKETAPEKILKVLRTEAQDKGLSLKPKIIASRAKLSHNTTKVNLRRLLEKKIIIRDEIGYKVVPGSFEEHLKRELNVSTKENTLPRVHDVHLCFKIENVQKCLSKNPDLQVEFQKLATQIEYIPVQRGPVKKKGTKPLIQGYKNRPPLPPLPSDDGQETNAPSGESSFNKVPPLVSPGLDFISRIFNPLDPMSIINLWYDPKKKYTPLNGGFQEIKHSGDYDLKFMMYWNGTIKIIIGCSGEPMDYTAFHESLADVDGVFYGKTGFSFHDVQAFFHIETMHIGNDVVGKVEFSGQSKLNITIEGVDGVLRRIYEKILGDGKYVIRDEVNLVNGNYDQHSFEAFDQYFKVYEQAGISPNQTNTQLFVTQKEIQKLGGMVSKIAVDYNASKQTIAQLIKSNAELRGLFLMAMEQGLFGPKGDPQGSDEFRNALEVARANIVPPKGIVRPWSEEGKNIRRQNKKAAKGKKRTKEDGEFSDWHN